jgi:hypothetical protein
MIAGLIDIAMMLATNVYIMMVSTRTNVNVTEWIGLRAGFGIYSGWVTAATILNATFLLKYFDYTEVWSQAEILEAIGLTD